MQPEEALVRRLVAPDGLHVVEDVLPQVRQQPGDVRAMVEVLGDRLGVFLGDVVQRGDFTLQPEEQVARVFGRSLHRLLQGVLPAAAGFAVAAEQELSELASGAADGVDDVAGGVGDVADDGN